MNTNTLKNTLVRFTTPKIHLHNSTPLTLESVLSNLM